MREAADLAVDFRCLFKVETSKGIGFWRPGQYPALLQQLVADQMRYPSEGLADADVDAWLAKVDGQQLCVAIGEMHQMHVAERRQVMQLVRRTRGKHIRGAQRHAGCHGNTEDLHELAAVQPHEASTSFTGYGSLNDG